MSPVEPVRSRFETFRGFSLDWSEFSLKSGWGTVQAFGSRVFGLAAVGLLMVAINPVWMPSQTPLQYEMRLDLKDAAKRLDFLEAKLSDMPIKLALMEQRISQQNESITRLNDLVLSLGKGIGGLIAALIAWALRQMFIEFGGKEKRGRT